MDIMYQMLVTLLPSMTHLVMVFAAVIIQDYILSHMMGLKLYLVDTLTNRKKKKLDYTRGHQ